jgi:hypothetical protein
MGRGCLALKGPIVQTLSAQFANRPTEGAHLISQADLARQNRSWNGPRRSFFPRECAVEQLSSRCCEKGCCNEGMSRRGPLLIFASAARAAGAAPGKRPRTRPSAVCVFTRSQGFMTRSVLAPMGRGHPGSVNEAAPVEIPFAAFGGGLHNSRNAPATVSPTAGPAWPAGSDGALPSRAHACARRILSVDDLHNLQNSPAPARRHPEVGRFTLEAIPIIPENSRRAHIGAPCVLPEGELHNLQNSPAPAGRCPEVARITLETIPIIPENSRRAHAGAHVVSLCANLPESVAI